MAINGSTSLVTANDLASVSTNWQSVQSELQADYGTTIDLSLANVTALFNDPKVTMVKFIQQGGAFRGAAMFVQHLNKDVECTLTGTDKTLSVADRKSVAQSMLKAAANRMITLGLGTNLLFGTVKAGGNYDTLLQTFSPPFVRILSAGGLFATYSSPATTVAATI